MTLDRQVKERILQDYKIIQEEIVRILNGGSNYLITHPDYPIPAVIMGTHLPLEDERGELNHYSGIRSALECALMKGVITQDKRLPFDLPEYLTTLVQQDIKNLR